MEPAEFSQEWFTQSTEAWRANKRRLKTGAFVYRCQHKYSATRICNRDCYKTEMLCRQHFALQLKEATKN